MRSRSRRRGSGWRGNRSCRSCRSQIPAPARRLRGRGNRSHSRNCDRTRAPLHRLRQVIEVIHRSTRHAKTRGPRLNGQPPRRSCCRIRRQTTSHHYHLSSTNRRRHQLCFDRCIHQLRNTIKRIPIRPGFPNPSVSGNKYPVARVIRRPSPRIARNKSISPYRIKGPAPILKGNS